MPITIDIEKDYLYKLGLKKAEEKVIKITKEKDELETKIKREKKSVIQKMKATNRFSNAEIMEFLSLDKEVFEAYLEEINTK